MITTVTIPCYNEGKRLQLKKFIEFFKIHEGINFVFVNDGSKDNTILLLKALQNQYKDRIFILDLKTNQGKSEAVRQGILFSLGFNPDIVGFWDADLSTPLTTIIEFLKIFENKPEIKWVFGARVKLLGREIKRNEFRHYFGRIFATFASIILHLPVYDTQCGAKLFRNEIILKELFQKRFKSKWIFDVEIIARLITKVGYETTKKIIFEYPLHKWRNVADSKLEYQDFVIAAHELFNIWIKFKKVSKE
jgi:glycosyltransferase involved in cell wall biosynthesis